MRHIIPISGKDSLATALVQLNRRPELPYEFMFNPTGAELPEVFEWIDRVEAYLGRPIVRVGENLIEIIEEHGYFLPSRRSRYCTKEAKIVPMEKFIGKENPCFVYYGIRADESQRTAYINPSGLITVVKPLVELGINLNGVYKIIQAAGLKPPVFFWGRLWQEVARRVGGETIIHSLLTDWQIDMLFAWRSRANCYLCYSQRLYEWVGLLEHYPALFWQSEAMEHKGSEYTFNSNGYSLQDIAAKAGVLFKKRCDKIVKIINSLKQGVINFGETEDDFYDILNVTSCGLFCGK